MSFFILIYQTTFHFSFIDKNRFILDSPWGGVPLLEVDGKLIGQSIAIARFIAREYGRAIMSENVNNTIHLYLGIHNVTLWYGFYVVIKY